jgi:DNA primase
MAKPVERPKSGIQPKAKPEESGMKSQRLLITWLTDEPALYQKIARYISIISPVIYSKV